MNAPAVLVTGGAGYIGSHTCYALAASGTLPVCLDNLSLGHRWAVRWGPLIEADLLETERVAEALREHRVSAVVHFAASAYVGDSVRDPAAYYRNNLLTLLSLMDAMRTAGVRTLLFSSSCSVYGNPVQLPVDEQHPTGPLSPYGQTKLDGENAIRWYARAYGFCWAGLRYFNAAGASPHGDLGESHEPETRLVPRAILAALGEVPPLEVYGSDYRTPDGTAIRDYVHVSDLASAHVLALQALQQQRLVGRDGLLNLGTGDGYSVLEVIRAVEAVAGRPVPFRLKPRREGDPAKIVADARLARRQLNWHPSYSELPNIVATAWHWHAKLRSQFGA